MPVYKYRGPAGPQVQKASLANANVMFHARPGSECFIFEYKGCVSEASGFRPLNFLKQILCFWRPPQVQNVMFLNTNVGFREPSGSEQCMFDLRFHTA